MKAASVSEIKAATAMVIAAGIVAHLVLNPTIIKMGANTSPINVRINDKVLPTPSGSANETGRVNNFSILGIPWNNIIPDINTLNTNKPMFGNVFTIIFYLSLGYFKGLDSYIIA